MTEKLAKQFHTWYLEATGKDKGLKEGEFNPMAQKSYEAMTEPQRDIDRYLARKILESYISKKVVQEAIEKAPKFEIDGKIFLNQISRIDLLKALTQKSDE